MEKYSIDFKKSAVKELKKINKFDLQKIVKKISSLCINPKPEGSQKLTGHKLHRIRQGNYRIFFDIDSKKKILYVTAIKNRNKAYKSS